MSDVNAFGSAFRRILQKVEEEHHREISQLCAHHSRELLQLRAKHEHQLAVDSSQNPCRACPVKHDLAEIQVGVLDVDAYLLRAKGVDEGKFEFCVPTPSPPQGYASESNPSPPQVHEVRASESNTSVLRNHVVRHLEDTGKAIGGSVNRYVMARGWNRSAKNLEPQTKLGKLIAHRHFDTISASAIVLNTILLGAISSFNASALGTADLPAHYYIADNAFSCLFLLEVTLRWIAEGACTFIVSSPHLSWNLFDIFVVGIDVIEHIIGWSKSNGDGSTFQNLPAMRMMRALRIVRALRVVRLMRFCRELRVMVLSLLRSGMMLLWSSLLMSLFFYIFAIVFMQRVTEYLTERVSESGTVFQLARRFPQDSTEGKLDKCFGSLSMTFYMLFQTVSGGISWGELTDLLSEVSVVYAVIFCFFVFISYFAMLNIITGFFVQAAMDAVKADEDEVIHEQMNMESSLMKQLQELFREADQDRNGKLLEDEFVQLVEKPRAHALLKSLGLHVNEARGLFALLDLDLTGEVAIDDFIIGCIRLRGGAQEVDLISLMYESRKLLASHFAMSKLIQSEFERLNKFEDRVDGCLKALASRPDLLASRPAA